MHVGSLNTMVKKKALELCDHQFLLGCKRAGDKSDFLCSKKYNSHLLQQVTMILIPQESLAILLSGNG